MDGVVQCIVMTSLVKRLLQRRGQLVRVAWVWWVRVWWVWARLLKPCISYMQAGGILYLVLKYISR